MKRKSHSHLPFAVLSDPGLVRDHNEDNLAITAFAAASELIPESLLCVLCDGVGGHQAGETASRMAVDQITNYIEGTDGSAPLIQMTSAIQSASDLVWQAAQASADLHGMASTAACAWIIGRRLFISTVGDSRIYLLKKGFIRQISVDHTWLQEALEAGLITREEAKGHPNAHVIKRFIGSENTPEVDVRLNFGVDNQQNHQGMQLDGGDILFMCSDGISDLIQETEISALLKSSDLNAALEALKQMAYQRGAIDNLSMIAVKIPTGGLPVTRKIKFLRLLVFACVLLFASLVGIYFGWLALGNP